tara:strand:+ start:87 stop:713 length:627 start_codon:yes stop_codon:yes gene_type:complete
MDKYDVEIMVVERALLFPDHEGHFEGFRPHPEVNYEERVLEHNKFLRRGDVEEDPSYKQPIAYVLIVNPRLRKVFAYQRKKADPRLQGKWSWGIGGHVERVDTGHPIHTSRDREIGEEIEIDGEIGEPKFMGYIYTEKDPVGRVHFGLLYIIETNAEIVRHRSEEIGQGGLRSVIDLGSFTQDPGVEVEEWSKIALQPLRDYFARLDA